MKKLNLIAVCVFMLAVNATFGQTNPEPHNLGTSDFSFTGFTDAESTDYAASTQGWRFGTEPFASEVGPAADDRVMVGQSVSITAGNIRNEGANGLSFRNSGSNHIGALAVALDASNREGVTVSFTVEDIADGATRQNGILLQYRLGTEGDFTTVENTTYLSDPAAFKAAQTFEAIALPEAVNNAPVVQLRWLYFYEAGGGARDRIRLDDITVSSEAGAVATVDVTFRVDMSQFTGTINPAGMHIAGSFPTDTWTPAARPMTNEGDGIWSWTEALEPGFALEYKFVRGPAWADGDENMTGQPCNAPGTSNRALTVPDEDTTLPANCYGSCVPCNVMVETSAVTFQVDMSLETIAAEGVGISGSFNDFTFEPMVDQGNGIYSYTTDLTQGASIEYKFRNGNDFESPPALCGTGGFGNRVLLVPMEDITLDLICYASCEPCEAPGETFFLILQVDASDITIDPAGIFIAGSFNGFAPEVMTDTGDGVYAFTAEVEEGSTVLYKFLNGDSFDGAEAVPEACGADDGFGGFNRTFLMPGVNTALDAVCFGSCSACESVIETFNLTLQVDASQISVISEGMHIAGNFNEFTPSPMVNSGGGIYTFTTAVEVGTPVLWKFVNSTDFSGVETVPGECGLPDGFGGFNRNFTMPATDFSFAPVCFSACTACLPVSVQNAEKHKQFQLYPNPNDGNFVMVAPATGMLDLRVYDLTGRLVHSNRLNTTEGVAVNYTQALLEKGYYLVELRYADAAYSARMIVE